jgi:hypothetical protein
MSKRGGPSIQELTRLIIGECAGGEGEAISQLTASWDIELAPWMHWFGSSASVPTLAITPRRPI